MENIRNQDSIGEKELLVVSFGTSFPDSRKKTIGAIEDALEHTFPEFSVRRAFTSGIILRAVSKKEGLQIDSITAALDRAEANGVSELIVQPTTMMNGFEYEKLMRLLMERRSCFDHVRVGMPLLSAEADFEALIQAIKDAAKEYDDGDTAICFMGHGTEAQSNQVYAQLQNKLKEKGLNQYLIGTVEATPSLEDVMAAIPESIHHVVLQPLMIVAGDHANNDMAGEEDDSWKSILERAGYRVTCVLRGLGELESIHRIFEEHVKSAAEI